MKLVLVVVALMGVEGRLGDGCIVSFMVFLLGVPPIYETFIL